MQRNEGFWQRVDELRRLKDVSVRQMSEDVGIAEGSLQSTRIRNQMPKVMWLYKFAQYFGVNMEYLYTGERESWEDNVVFRKMASDQRFMDICARLMSASDVEIEMVMRLLDIKKDTSHATTGESA